MKNAFYMWALTAVVPVAVMAQQSLDEEVNAELDRMYQTQPAAPVRAQKAPSVQVNVQAQPQVSAAQTQNTYQASNQAAMQAQAAPVVLQKQPTTYIEATPMVESNAEKLRKSRQDAEVQTEQKIVEKLEQSRLDDEKNRAEVLFGDKFNSLVNKNQQPVAAQPAPIVPVVVPEQVVQPAPVIVQKEEDDKMDREAIRGEVNAALAELKTTQTQEEKPKKSYFSVMAGSGDYPDARNVKGQYSLGFAYGKYFSDRVVGEGSFTYSNYQVEQAPAPGNGGYGCTNPYGACEYYPRITDMNQYGTAGLVKYQMLGGNIRPEVGGLMSYTYRTFTDKQFALSDATVTSQALDAGVMLGASLELSDDFQLGLDYRYMWNMTNKVDGNTLQKSSIYKNQSNYTPIEEMNYYNFSVVGRATF